MTKPDAVGTHIARTLRILELLALTPLSAPQVSATLDIHARTARRVMEALANEDYLTREGDTRRIYSPTLRLVALAALTLDRYPVARRGRAYVQLLHERTRASAHLVVPAYDKVVCVCHAAGVLADEHPHLREMVPAHATAGGLVLLAHRDSWRKSLYEAGLAALTERTIIDPEQMDAFLAQVRADGHAIEDGEFQHGVRAIAAPVRFNGEVVAAIVASHRRMAIDNVLPHVLRAARDLTQDLADAERR